ncbi:MAG: hypothetical protein V9G29_08495 [Burkholderiaceae bacterium]
MQNDNMTVGSGTYTPENDNARWQAGTGTDKNDNGRIVANLETERKRYASLAAPMALAGYQLHELTDGSYLVARWDRSLNCPDLRAVQAFCQRAGVYL